MAKTDTVGNEHTAISGSHKVFILKSVLFTLILLSLSLILDPGFSLETGFEASLLLSVNRGDSRFELNSHVEKSKKIDFEAQLVYVVLSELNDTKLRDSARSAWAFETASKPGQTVVFLLPGKSSENIESQTLDYINSEPLVHHLKNTDDSKTAQSLFTSKSIDWISQNFKGLQWLTFIDKNYTKFIPKRYACALNSKKHSEYYAIGKIRLHATPENPWTDRNKVQWPHWKRFPAHLSGEVSSFSRAIVDMIAGRNGTFYENSNFEQSIGLEMSWPEEIRDNTKWVEFDVEKYDKIAEVEVRPKTIDFNFFEESKIFNFKFFSSMFSEKSDSYRMENPVINQSAEIVYMVISRRSDIDLRETVRQTWAKGILGSVIFPVAGLFCPWESSQRSHWSTCDQSDLIKCYIPEKVLSEESDQISYIGHESSIQKTIFYEQNVLEIVGLIDSYHNLTMKQLHGFTWIHDSFPKMKWVIKIDIDTYPNVGLIEKTLMDRNLPETKAYTMLANLRSDKVSPKKPFQPAWHVPNYNKTFFPIYPNGAFVALSSNIVKYFALNSSKLSDYTVDDAALGIWIEESHFKNDMEWVDVNYSKHKKNSTQPIVYLEIQNSIASAGCGNNKWNDVEFDNKMILAVGHRLDNATMRICDEEFRSNKFEFCC